MKITSTIEKVKAYLSWFPEGERVERLDVINEQMHGSKRWKEKKGQSLEVQKFQHRGLTGLLTWCRKGYSLSLDGLNLTLHGVNREELENKARAEIDACVKP